MKNIKHLYLAAKNSRKQSDIIAYQEAVNILLEKYPRDYVANLEYIISSNIGLSTFESFTSKYGMSIECFREAKKCVEECIEKCEKQKKDPKEYKELENKLEAFHQKYAGCFAMYEYYREEDMSSYLDAYYGFNKNDIQNRKLVAGMVGHFKEQAIPDAIITSDMFGESAKSRVLQYFDESTDTNPMTYQFIYDAYRSIPVTESAAIEHLDRIKKKGTLITIEMLRERANRTYEESMIMGNMDPVMRYTESEISSIEEWISYNEYLLICMEDASDIMKQQKLIYSLYEEFGHLLDDSEDHQEATWISNTTNKKTGAIPGYLATNQDLQWGEDEAPKSKRNRYTFDDDDEMDDLESYRRPSTKKNGDDSIQQTTSSSDESSDKDDSPDNSSKGNPSNPVNNYYYYTYNNSNNRHHTDDHSVHHRTINDDHSTGKTINDDHSTNKNIRDDHSSGHMKESSEPWELDIFPQDEVYNEGVIGDISKKTGSMLKNMTRKIMSFIGMKRSIANIQRLDRPEMMMRRSPLTIPGTNIPLPSDDAGMTESVEINDFPIMDFTESSNLEALFEAGYYIMEEEDVLAQLGRISKSFKDPLSGLEIKKVIANLRKKFDAEIRFISPDSNMSLAIGPASVVETDKATINKLLKGTEDVMTMPNRQTGYTGKTEKVILVSMQMLLALKIKSARDIELIISHEYGHVRTLDQVTDRDLREYSIKRSTLDGFINIIPHYMRIPSTDVHSELNLIYHQLKVEKLANDYAKIDPSDLIEVIIHNRPTGKDVGIDVKNFLNWKISEKYEEICITATKQAYSSINNAPKEMMIYLLKESINVYKSIVSDKRMRAKLIRQCYVGLAFYGIANTISGIKNGRRKGVQTESFDGYELYEAVGDADDNKPQSDNPIRDIMTDVDKGLTKAQQGAKKKVQGIQQAATAIVKPVKRTMGWVNGMIQKWKDADENKIKEDLADPHARKNLFSAIKTAVAAGSLAKAGLLFNPIFLFLTITKRMNTNSNIQRIRDEMIGEIKTEIEVIDEKIKDADMNRDNSAKYKLMRHKNELEKKLIRVAGDDRVRKLI